MLNSFRGIRIHPHAYLSKSRETQHTMIVGPIGSGRTPVLSYMLKDIVKTLESRQGSRLILFDTKGDFLSGLQLPKNMGYHLFSENDSRSSVWAVGKDITTEAEAKLFATQLLYSLDQDKNKENLKKDINVLTNMIISLQKQHGESWYWETLVLSAMDAGLNGVARTLIPLTYGHKPKFSFKEWISQSGDDRPVLFFKASPGCSDSRLDQKKWISAFAATFCQHIVETQSPTPSDKRFWLVFSDHNAFPPVLNLPTKLQDLGSRGVACVFIVNEIEDLRKQYGEFSGDILALSCKTRVILRHSGKLTNLWAKHVLGNSGDGMRLLGSPPENSGVSAEGAGVMGLNDQVLSSLGPTDQGIDGILILSSNNGVYRLTWPYTHYSTERKQFEKHVPDLETKNLVLYEQSFLGGKIIYGFRRFDNSVFGTLEHDKRGATILEWTSKNPESSILTLVDLRQLYPWIGISLSEKSYEEKEFWSEMAKSGLVEMLV